MQLIFYKNQLFLCSATEIFVVEFAVEEVRSMKFCDKLTKQRKNNNMSQEQLADRLGVSRQAVSKWESGTSMPDMEKIMQLCKILNCSLDDLVDDSACGNAKVVEQKANIHTYLQEVLDFVTKTLNMFWSMRLVEKIKCILEMLCIILIIALLWGILGQVIYSIFDGIISMLPNLLYRVIYNIASIIYKVFGIIVGAILFIHIFKIRYLDYFVTIEDDTVTNKKIEKPVDEDRDDDKRQFIEKKKNKIIIRDPKHSTYSFFTSLAHLVLWGIKFILLVVAFFGILSFIFLVFGCTFSIWNIGDGIFFLGTTIVLLGCILINFMVLRVIYNFILNQKHNLKRIFYVFTIGLILVGVGFGISFCTYLTFDKYDNTEEIEYTTKENIIEMDDYITLDFIYDSRVEIIIDNSRDDIKIETIYNKDGYVNMYHYISYGYDYDHMMERNYYIYSIDYYDGSDNFADNINYLVDKIKNKQRIDDYEYEGISKYKITISEYNLEKIKDNYDRY